MGLLYIINTVDMEGRLIKQPEAYIQKKHGQGDSHTYSYLQMREFYQRELGWTMGLDRVIEEQKSEQNEQNNQQKNDEQKISNIKLNIENELALNN